MGQANRRTNFQRRHGASHLHPYSGGLTPYSFRHLAAVSAGPAECQGLQLHRQEGLRPAAVHRVFGEPQRDHTPFTVANGVPSGSRCRAISQYADDNRSQTLLARLDE
jgi:hypothetical protein